MDVSVLSIVLSVLLALFVCYASLLNSTFGYKQCSQGPDCETFYISKLRSPTLIIFLVALLLVQFGPDAFRAITNSFN